MIARSKTLAACDPRCRNTGLHGYENASSVIAKNEDCVCVIRASAPGFFSSEPIIHHRATRSSANTTPPSNGL